jgi:hypothetical protein
MIRAEDPHLWDRRIILHRHENAIHGLLHRLDWLTHWGAQDTILKSYRELWNGDLGRQEIWGSTLPDQKILEWEHALTALEDSLPIPSREKTENHARDFGRHWCEKLNLQESFELKLLERSILWIENDPLLKSQGKLLAHVLRRTRLELGVLIPEFALINPTHFQKVLLSGLGALEALGIPRDQQEFQLQNRASGLELWVRHRFSDKSSSN